MIDLVYLETLYNEARLQECLEATQTFLLFNHQSVEALLIKAKCEFVLAQDQETGEEMEILYASSYNDFETVLSLQPHNEDALLYAAYIIIYIFRTNLQQGVIYCDQLQLSPDSDKRLKALNYRREAHYLLEEPDNVLADIDSLMSVYSHEYKNNKDVLDHTLNGLYLHKAQVFLDLKKDIKSALQSYKDGYAYASEGRLEDAFIAKLAFENNDYDFGSLVYSQLSHNGIKCEAEELYELYKTALDIIENGYVNESLFYGLMITMRILGEEYFGKDYEADVFNLAKQYTQSHPHWHLPYHFAGTVLFEAENYHEACPYLEKSLEIKGLAITLNRYLQAYYHTYNAFPVIEKLPEDHPTEYYNSGVYFSDFAESITDNYLHNAAAELKCRIYENSYTSFYRYFCKGEGPALYTDRHIFAMCCNNYGIALSDVHHYEKAVEVHELGYSISPFWEQLSSWSTALIELNRSEEAINILKTALAYSEEYLDFHNYLKLKGDLLDQTFKIGQTEEARELLEKIENEYTSFIEANKDELPEDYLFDLDQSYIVIQNIRYEFLKEGSLEEANRAWHEQLQKNPDDNSAWYMLMQNYYELKDYAQCIACADNYQKIKLNTVEASDNLHVHYKRGISYLHLNDLEQALVNLKVALSIHLTNHQVDIESEISIYIHLSNVTHTLKKWDECKQYAWEGIACFNRNSWGLDSEMELLMVQYADACYATGDKQSAIETIDNLLEVKQDSVEGLKRKKEWKSKGFLSFFKK